MELKITIKVKDEGEAKRALANLVLDYEVTASKYDGGNIAVKAKRDKKKLDAERAKQEKNKKTFY